MGGVNIGGILIWGTPSRVADDADAFTVNEFCARHRISVQLFCMNRCQMPRTFNVGKRVLISKEAAAAWRRARENAALATE